MAPKKIGITKIAELAGVAPSTVSHVLNGTASISDKVRDRVIAVARDTGYLSMRRSKATIGALQKVLLAIPPNAMPENDVNIVSWTILTALTQWAERQSVRIVVHEIQPDASFAQVSQAAETVRADGIILLNDDRHNLLKAVARSGIPAVLINGEDPSMLIDSVTPANRFGAQSATRRLLELGHRRILHLTWGGRKTVERRKDGFLDGFREAGLPESDAVLLFAKGYEPRHGEAAIEKWLQQHPDRDGVTAIFCAADNLAFGAIRALKAAGLSLPQDMSIMGFDGVTLGELQVTSLSTVEVPLEEFAQSAFTLLEHRAQDAGTYRASRRVELGCRMADRESTIAV
jgi:DNA-binding LacI/PurR family transcriptional regulator